MTVRKTKIFVARAVMVQLALSFMLVHQATAERISIFDFLIVEDYEDINLVPGNYATPIVIEGNTYTTDSGVLRYGGLSSNGLSIGNNTGGTGWIDVVLETPVRRAGAYVGGSADVSWGVDAEFYDEADNLLGIVRVTEPGSGTGQDGREFAGWEATSGLIRRMRFTGPELGGSVLVLDDLVTGVVPDPVITQCSDGIDNDGDGSIDLDDSKCKSLDQDSEKNQNR